MNPTEFWYKLVDMTQSNNPVFSLGGRAITEKQLLWVIGLSALCVILILVRWAIVWVTGGSPKPIQDKAATNPPATSASQLPASLPKNDATTAPATPPTAPTVTNSAPPATIPTTGTPQELLTDTSDRKRTLHDFVTPDTIHADVMKQTLNNDFPYQTMKPDPTKISGATPVAAAPTVVPPTSVEAPVTAIPQTEVKPAVAPMFGAPTPMLFPIPNAAVTPATAPGTTPINTAPEPVLISQTGNPNPVAPTPPPQVITATPITTTPVTPSSLPPLPATVTTPVASVSAAPPTPSATLPPLPTVEAAPVVTQPSVPFVPLQAPEMKTPISVESPTSSVQQTAPQSSVLPPLPQKDPSPAMVVGVADATTSVPAPTQAKAFNPMDPIIP